MIARNDQRQAAHPAANAPYADCIASFERKEKKFDAADQNLAYRRASYEIIKVIGDGSAGKARRYAR
jgi:hypothetical protein